MNMAETLKMIDTPAKSDEECDVEVQNKFKDVEQYPADKGKICRSPKFGKVTLLSKFDETTGKAPAIINASGEKVIVTKSKLKSLNGDVLP